jgi:hypothetical protein
MLMCRLQTLFGVECNEGLFHMVNGREAEEVQEISRHMNGRKIDGK